MSKIGCKKSIKLLNVANKVEVDDTLHRKAIPSTTCTIHACNASVMTPVKFTNDSRSKSEVETLAKEFLDEYYHSIKRYNSEQHLNRWAHVKREIDLEGTYELNQTELVYGAKLAWRNAPRCIGRIQWSKLQVFDARYVTTAHGMFEAICKHIKYSTNKGNLRSAITIFPQRTESRHDFRIWNSQFLGYAGYINPDGTILGDPINLEFTEICRKLGWIGKGKMWDLLPLVLSANGDDPEWFEIPRELVLEVKLTHPRYDWFADLNLQWYALPAVANMLFDCGGLQFPAAPFSGWYMETEIAARDLCDAQRFNILQIVAEKMGLDIRTNINLWKDKAVVEVSCAVLHSFQKENITIVDHHTASESFMKHFENETKVRGGCPADWIWITPPISGSLTPVFHQEMSLYYLKPSYEYQERAWKTHIWKSSQENGGTAKNRRKFTFKEIARAVKFTSKLFTKALSKRIKATILYATETGKSENYAKKLAEIFGHAFNVQVVAMSDYDIIHMEHEALILVVTSTFGNGDPPEMGEAFARKLYAMKVTGTAVETDVNGRFAVFALGSSAYPNYCAFGIYVDKLLSELGSERLLPVTCGDEMAGQEQSFNDWAVKAFQMGCEAFCIDDEVVMQDATSSLKKKLIISSQVAKIVNAQDEATITSGLSKAHGRNVRSCKVIASRNLHAETTSRWTQQVIFERDFSRSFNYEPGDHVAIYPANEHSLVDLVLERMHTIKDPDQPIQLMTMKETHGFDGILTTWEPHERLPQASYRTLLTRYLDITTPPTPNFLLFLAKYTEDNKEKLRLNTLAKDPHEYEEWKHWHYPNLPEVLNEFPKAEIDAIQLLNQLPLLKPRFYSISSSPLVHKNEIHITVAVVRYKTEGGDGPMHFGVCSNFLKNLKSGDSLECFFRSSSSFHLPNDPLKPVIMVGPGTGIAPFRGFWHHRYYMSRFLNQKIGKMSLFFGCRTKDLDLYCDEKNEMAKADVLTNTHLALSRESQLPKTYVQDILVRVGASVYKEIVEEHGHFYVCGDCTMAECVFQHLKAIIKEHGKMSEREVEEFMTKLRIEDRYHEDIFGITLRTEEIHRQSRETARSKINSTSN